MHTVGGQDFCTVNWPTNDKQLPAFPLEVGPGFEPGSQRWEARVLPLCHRGPSKTSAKPRNNWEKSGLFFSFASGSLSKFNGIQVGPRFFLSVKPVEYVCNNPLYNPTNKQTNGHENYTSLAEVNGTLN